MRSTLLHRILRLVAGAALLVWLIQWVDWHQLLAVLAGCKPGWAAAGVILFAAAILPAALRLKALFPPRQVSFGSALRFTLESSFFGQLLPTGLGGDAYRSLRLRNAAGGWIPTVGLLVFERATGALTLIVPALACAVLQYGGTGITTKWHELIGGSQEMFYLLTAVGILFVVGTLILVSRAPPRLQRIRHAFVSSLRQLTMGAVISVVFTSLCFHALRILGTLAFLESVGSSVALADLVAAMALTLLATLVPVTGALGVREGILVYCLHAFGVPLPQALTVALLGRLVVVLQGLIGALVFLAGRSQARTAVDHGGDVDSNRSEAPSPLVHR